MQEVEKMEGYGQESYQAKVSVWGLYRNPQQSKPRKYNAALLLLQSLINCCDALLLQDSTGTDVTLGSCLDGIFVKHKNGGPLLLFR